MIDRVSQRMNEMRKRQRALIKTKYESEKKKKEGERGLHCMEEKERESELEWIKKERERNIPLSIMEIVWRRKERQDRWRMKAGKRYQRRDIR